MIRQKDNVDGGDTSTVCSRDRRVLVLFVVGGLLLLRLWFSQVQALPTQANQYIYAGQYLYIQRLATINTVKPPGETGSLKRTTHDPTSLATATANQPVSPAVLSLFFNLGFPLNLATMEELELLPGIGPSLAQAIYTHRLQHGNVTAIHELEIIPGIGKKTVQRLEPLLDFDQ